MTVIQCQSRGCQALLKITPPASASSEDAVLAVVRILTAAGWEVIDQHIACPMCAVRAPFFGVEWDGGARTLASSASAR